MAYRADLFDAPPPRDLVRGRGRCARRGRRAVAGRAARHSLPAVDRRGSRRATGDARSDAAFQRGSRCRGLPSSWRRSIAMPRRSPPSSIRSASSSTWRAADDVRLCPLIFGYVNYATPGGAIGTPSPLPMLQRSREADSPAPPLAERALAFRRVARSRQSFVDHLRWLVGAEAQCDVIPRNERAAQPAVRLARRRDQSPRRAASTRPPR